MANKYYAVYRGVSSGIFDNWHEASRRVSNISGAIYKGFDTEKAAVVWMKMLSQLDRKNGVHVPNEMHDILQHYVAEAKADEKADKQSYQLYTDGSYDKESGRYAWAFILLNPNNQVHSFNSSAAHAGNNNMWQINGEIEAVSQGLRWAQQNGVKRIVVNYDLINIQKWGDNEWKANKPETQSYKGTVNQLRTDGMFISFNKIKAHSGSEYNEMCDYLAKQSLGITKYDNMKAISKEHLAMIKKGF